MRHDKKSQVPTLKQLQRWMKWIITDPRGVQEALKVPHPEISSAERFRPKNFGQYLQRYSEPTPTCLSKIRNTDIMSREERLDIYAEGYFLRICEALKEDYPALLRLLGDEGFFQIVADYLKEYPSQFTNLADLGCALPEFLKSHDVSHDLPYVVDLAHLEWAVNQAIYSPDPQRLAAERVQQIELEQWPHIAFKLHPSFQLFSSIWNIDQFWRQECDEIELISGSESESRGHQYFALGVDGVVTVTSIGHAQATALELMSQGASLGEICERLQETNSNENDNGVQSWFSDWIQGGLIYDLITSARERGKDEQ